MSEIKDVSGTAFVVAEFRAEENREVTPLYRTILISICRRISFGKGDDAPAAGERQAHALGAEGGTSSDSGCPSTRWREAVISKTTGDSGITSLVESFATMGAPWLSGIRDIQSLARELSLNVVENFKTSELYQTYWLARPMTSPIFGFYSVCTLGH